MSGAVATDCPPPRPADGWAALAEGDMAIQSAALYDRLDATLADAGGISNAVRLHLFQHDKRWFPTLESVRVAKEGATPAPSSGLGLSRPGGADHAWLELEAIGLTPDGVSRWGGRSTVAAGGAGKSASYYSQVAQAGPYAFLAGMIAIDPETHRTIRGFDDVEEEGRWLRRGRSHPDSRTGPIAAQAWQLYRRVEACVAELGGGLDDVVSATVFLSDPGDTADFLRVHAAVFGAAAPTLQLALVDEVGHAGTLIEIECTALIGGEPRRVGGLPDAGPAVVVAGELAFAGDQLGLDAAGRPVQRATALGDERLRAIVADLAGPDAALEARLAEAAAALEALGGELAAAAVDPASVGSLWLRASRPCPRAALAELLARATADAAPAITIVEGDAIAQSPRATASISAICGGLEERR